MEEKLGNCQKSLNSTDCAYNAYCPLPNTKYNSWCNKCNVDMVPGFSCNCMNNLVLNCALCDNTECIKCIKGHILENGKCKAGMGTCDDLTINCAHNAYCPPGNGQRDCLRCAIGPKHLQCYCAGALIIGCKDCLYDKCRACKRGYNLVYGICLEKNDFGKCIYGDECQYGTGCKFIVDRGYCRPCSELTQDERCNCGGNKIFGCKRCDYNQGCETCARVNGKKYQYGLGRCLYGGDCRQNDSSFNCSVGFQCNTEIGNVCEPCENNIYDNIGCNCRGDKKLYKCQVCHREDPGMCIQCIYGYTLEYKSDGIEGEWWCRPNYCTNEELKCVDGYTCPENPIGITQCQLCVVGARTSCTCFYQKNCQTCDNLIHRCATCLPGFILKDEYCVVETNKCKQNGSLSCNNGYTCQGSIGADCDNCEFLQEDNYCNCNTILQKNCRKCSNTECEICIKGYLPINGVCVSNMCGKQINTQNCQFGFYCSSLAASEKEECKICDIQEEQCNCGNLLGCQTCGTTIDTCDKCFLGYEKNTIQQCQIKRNICDLQQRSSLCNTETYCSGLFGEPCQSCKNIKKGQECKCGTSLQKNCLECNENLCSKCIDGYECYLGKCIQNVCISGEQSHTCAFGNFCPSYGSGSINCVKCPSTQEQQCQCGTDNCITCGTNSNTCGSCQNGYKLNAANKCVLKSNICDQNSTSALCNSGYYCNSKFGSECVDCNAIEVGQFCNCEGKYIMNCSSCNKNLCARCQKGFLLVDEICIQNQCNNALTQTNCVLDYQCPIGSKSNDPCQQCSASSEAICNCGNALNCTTCGSQQNTCKTCIYGYYLDQTTQLCVEITDKTKNICDLVDLSSRCDDQHFCNSVYGQLCVICSTITPEKNCNCSGQLQNNCQLCLGKNCQKCLPGYYLNDGKCYINQCSDSQPCQYGFYCQTSQQKTSTCDHCTVNSKLPCMCGQAPNCQTCSNIPNQCQTCLDGFYYQFGQCIPYLPCISEADCNINYFCNTDNTCRACNETQQQKCNCGMQVNCQSCKAAICQFCIAGYQLNLNNECTIPICNEEIPPLSVCVGPNIFQKCQPENSSICNCGDAKNCRFCEQLDRCDACLPGFTLVNGQCYEQTPDFYGVCVAPKDSQFCLQNSACVTPPNCSPCSRIPAGYVCKCQNAQILNCTNCNGASCTACATGFLLRDNACVELCNSSNQCKIGQFCSEIGCARCDGSKDCNCGRLIDCLQCEAEKCIKCRENFKLNWGSCKGCVSGFKNVEGECVKNEESKVKVVIFSSVLAGIVVLGVVGAFVGVIVFYKKKVKSVSVKSFKA